MKARFVSFSQRTLNSFDLENLVSDYAGSFPPDAKVALVDRTPFDGAIVATVLVTSDEYPDLPLFDIFQGESLPLTSYARQIHLSDGKSIELSSGSEIPKDMKVRYVLSREDSLEFFAAKKRAKEKEVSF